MCVLYSLFKNEEKLNTDLIKDKSMVSKHIKIYSILLVIRHRKWRAECDISINL